MERTFHGSSRLRGMELAQKIPDFADLFERYARDLVERARPFGPSDRVLDLGCGTGIVARVLRDRLGGGARIAGLDINAGMLAKARSLAPELEWHEGSAAALPFADRAYEVVLAQQVLQFVPDRAAAAREVRRVLAPGGRLVASTWRPRHLQPLFEAVCQVAEKHLGPGTDKRCSLDGEELCALLAGAGFVDIQLGTASLEERHHAFPVQANLGAMGFANVAPATLAAIEAA